MKNLYAFLLLIVLASCQVTETIHLNPDGSGTITVKNVRDKQSLMDANARGFRTEQKFRDTTFVVQDYINKYQETFLRFSKADQALFLEHAEVEIHIKEDPFELDDYSVVSYDFKKIEKMPNIFETMEVANKLKENHPLNHGKGYYKISYSFDGSIFKRKAIIVDPEKLEEYRKRYGEREAMYAKKKVLQSYVFDYHFPRKIKSVSNPKALIGEDKMSLKIEIQLYDCLKNPEITDLEVILE